MGRKIVLSVLLVGLMASGWLLLRGVLDPAQRALDRFYSSQGPEATLMDPLILAGERVVPLVIRDVQNSSMPHRRYAIGFLGNGAYRQAIPVLEEILANDTEVDYFRADALVSLYKIDRDLGLRHAQEHLGRKDFLGYMAKEVAGETEYVRMRRTYAQALAGGDDFTAP